jgi:hypothetical protein
MKASLAQAKSKAKEYESRAEEVDEADEDALEAPAARGAGAGAGGMPDLSSLAGMFGGGGGKWSTRKSLRRQILMVLALQAVCPISPR